MKHLFSLTLASLLAIQCNANFRHKIGKQEAAQNDLFHDSIRKQLAHSQNVTTLADGKAIHDLASDSLDISSNDNLLAAATGLQVYLNSTVPSSPAPPQACVNALTATVNCNSTISLMPVDPLILNDTADLQTVCTSTCTQSLASYRANVVSSCAGFSVQSNNVTYPATYAVDTIIGAYTVQCLQDPTTQAFCGPLLTSLNATGGLLALPTSKLCTFCTLKTLNATLSNPATYSAPLADLLSSAISTCGSSFTTYNVTNAPAPQVTTGPGSLFGQNSTNGAPAANCVVAGKNTTTTSVTTCSQVATQFSITETDVLASNPTLDPDCNIASGTTLCLPLPCHTYTIQTNDTCQSVVDSAGSMTGVNITTVQLQSFNPELGTFCQAMALRVGLKICLTPNGGFPSVIGTSAAVPSATPTATAPIPSPTVNGTTSACGRYYQVQDGDICNSIVLKNSISLPDFLTINPEINVNCTNLWLGYFYCVAPFPALTTTASVPIITTNFSTAITTASFVFPTSFTETFSTLTFTAAGVPAPTNVAAGTRTVACGYYYNIAAGDTLASISTTVGVNSSDLVSWNPELATGLPGVNSAICVRFPIGNYTLASAPTPSNIAANTTTNCAEFYTVQSGDGCTSITSAFSLTIPQFLSLNAGLNPQCTNLVLGLAYCVFPTSPFSSTISTGPPANVAAGTITAGCTQYYTVVSGDSCPTIESKFNLTSAQFVALNPEINVQCSNILLGEAYCVHTSNSTLPTGPPSNVAAGTITAGCTEYYTVVSGDSCPIIETKFNLTSAQFTAFNPEINSQCSNILLGEAYCVQSSNTTLPNSGPPSNVAAGTITTGCTEYYTIVSGDSCSAIETKFNVTLAQFITMNPEINAQCTNILLGEAYCVHSSNSTTPPTGPPANLASGSLNNCTAYYTIVSGDNCPAIDTKFSIAASDFFRWNPEVNTACTNIALGEAYCVSGGPSACKKTYTVQSGDFCSKITASQAITQAQLNALNPQLDANCDLSVGEILCVG